jgi:hypothetical protein
MRINILPCVLSLCVILVGVQKSWSEPIVVAQFEDRCDAVHPNGCLLIPAAGFGGNSALLVLDVTITSDVDILLVDGGFNLYEEDLCPVSARADPSSLKIL